MKYPIECIQEALKSVPPPLHIGDVWKIVVRELPKTMFYISNENLYNSKEDFKIIDLVAVDYNGFLHWTIEL